MTERKNQTECRFCGFAGFAEGINGEHGMRVISTNPPRCSQATSQNVENCDRLLNVREAAAFLNLAVGSVYHLASQSRIPCVRLSNRCLRFRKSDLTAWVDAHSCEATSSAFFENSAKGIKGD